MKLARIAVFVCAGCAAEGSTGAPPEVPVVLPSPPPSPSGASAQKAPRATAASSQAIRVVPLELFVDDRSGSGPSRLELRSDGAIYIDGERRAEVKEGAIFGAAGDVSVAANGRINLTMHYDKEGPQDLHLSADDDLLDKRGEGIHVSPKGEVFDIHKKKPQKVHAHFLALPEGAHRTAVLMVLALMVYAKEAPNSGPPVAPPIPPPPPPAPQTP